MTMNEYICSRSSYGSHIANSNVAPEIVSRKKKGAGARSHQIKTMTNGNRCRRSPFGHVVVCGVVSWHARC
jgi:hypothetical protein